MNKTELVKLLKVVPKNGFDIIFHDRRESKLFFTTDRPLTANQKMAANILLVQVTLAAMPSYYKKGYRYGAKLLERLDGSSTG